MFSLLRSSTLCAFKMAIKKPKLFLPCLHNISSLPTSVSINNCNCPIRLHCFSSGFTQYLNSFSTCAKCFNDYTDDLDEEGESDREYDDLVKDTLGLSELGHQVFVVQPYIKWGKLKKRNTTPELQLAEAEALINTLPNWKVVNSKAVPTLSLKKFSIIGKGNIELLKEIINNNLNITAVFMSVNMLSPGQHKAFEKEFNVPIFDRYTIVIQIFKLHAKSSVAKLQVEMGEIPYLWTRLKHDDSGISDKMGGGATVGGPGESYLEIKRRLLQDKERKVKNKLKKLQSQRELLRRNRQDLELPVIAVVGYTNAGKTSLIKVLTKEEKIQPKNVLFATLDVTVHAGYMPCGLKVLFVDTVGFLSDIPTNLIQSFIATLEDAIQADLIIHVQDISHPDLVAQNQHVLETLQSINLPEKLLKTMITVGNKVDLVKDDGAIDSSSFPVSCTLGYGIDDLKRQIELGIIQATGQILMKFRVPNGGEELAWLHKETNVIQVNADEKDSEFTIVDSIITDTNLKKFKYKFITSKVSKKDC